MAGLLDGIRIVDWTLWQVGSSGTALLADMGADVIKIEQKGAGDSLRGMTTFFGRSMLMKGRNIHFEEHNRNKRGIALDLNKPGAREIICRLIEKSHVFATNFRPKARFKHGLDYASVKKQNPEIIYASASTYGEKGPELDAPGLELVAYARSGVMWASGEEGMPPIFPTVGMGDRAGSDFLAMGILGALVAKERQGISQEVRVSQLGAMVHLQGWSVTSVLSHGTDYPRAVRSKARNPLYNYYECKGGRWIALGIIQSERYWSSFCKVIEKPELETDPRFSDAGNRAENCEALASILDQVFYTRTFEEWESRFRSADLIFTKMNTLSDLASDPQVIANDYIVDWEHPAFGRTKAVGFPIFYSQTPLSLRMPAPEVGQHNEEVLVDICGYSWDDVARFRDEGSI